MITKYVTYCSGRKRMDEEEIEAIQRYQSSRIDEVYEIHREDTIILSGVYGLLETNEKIPYYDHLLQWNEIGQLKEKVIKQIQNKKINKIVFYKKWLNQLQYQAIIMMATSELKIPLEIVDLTPKDK